MAHSVHFLPLRLFFEVTVEEALEAAAVASFVFSHFVYGVMDGVETEFFSTACDAHLVFVSTSFSSHTLFEVCTGIPYALAEELSKFCSVLSFFECIALEGLCDFGIAFAVGLTAHCEVHANFTALAVEVSGKVFDHFLVAVFGYADFVLSNECKLGFGVEFIEFAAGCAADRALFGSFVTFVNIAAYGADEFLFHISEIYGVSFMSVYVV